MMRKQRRLSVVVTSLISCGAVGAFCTSSIAATTSQTKSVTTSQTKSATTPQTTSATATSKKSSTTTANTTSTKSAAAPDPKEIDEQLRDLNDTLKRTYNAANNLLLECSRAYNADAMDNVIMDPWMEGQPGLAHVMPPPFPGAMHPLPPRKKWVDHDLAQIKQILEILTSEVNAIGAASTLDTDLKVSTEIMLDNLHQVDSEYAQLVTFCNPTAVDEKGLPAYDKIGIGRAAQGLKDETAGLNVIRKRMLRQLKNVKK